MACDQGEAELAEGSAWPAYVERVFRCTCGEEIGVCKWPAHSVEDGGDLGVSYVALRHSKHSHVAPRCVALWKEGTGDAGFYDQRCPGCNAQLVQPPEQEALF